MARTSGVWWNLWDVAGTYGVWQEPRVWHNLRSVVVTNGVCLESTECSENLWSMEGTHGVWWETNGMQQKPKDLCPQIYRVQKETMEHSWNL